MQALIEPTQILGRKFALSPSLRLVVELFRHFGALSVCTGHGETFLIFPLGFASTGCQRVQLAKDEPWLEIAVIQSVKSGALHCGKLLQFRVGLRKARVLKAPELSGKFDGSLQSIVSVAHFTLARAMSRIHP
jgi:hypothetical protein